MRITVNGTQQQALEPLTVAELLEAEGEPSRHVLVEVNGVYVPPGEHDRHTLQDGDRIEIILPAFGG